MQQIPYGVCGLFSLLLMIFSFPAYGDYDFDVLTHADQQILSSDAACQVESKRQEPPRQVSIGVMVKKLTDINEIDNTFTLTGYLSLIWCNEELASRFHGKTQKRIFLENGAQDALEAYWSPDPYFVNNVQRHMSENKELTWFRDGTVHYREKFNVVLTANYDLHKFPFDQQTLKINIESFTWTADHMRFIEDTSFSGISDSVSVPEWKVDNLTTRILVDADIIDRAEFSEYQQVIEISHRPGYFMLKVILPLIMLVTVSWVTFWTKRSDIRYRLSPLLTVMLTIVAFNFTISTSLPKVNYLTFFDQLIAFSFITVFLAVGVCLVINIIDKKGKEELGDHLNTICKRSFPFLYIGGILILTYHSRIIQ